MWEVWLWLGLYCGLVVSSPRLGESTELAWLLVHDAPPSQQHPPQQAPLMMRRITPKSVFLTPTFTSCSEGYRQDGMGRCVKVVKLDQQAQWEFFLQKLNSMYAAPPEPSKKENHGPLKLPIPIEEEPPATTTEEPITTTLRTTIRPTMRPTTQPTTPPTTPPTTEPPSTTPFPTTTEQPFLIVVADTTTEQPDLTTVTLPPSTEYTTPPPPLYETSTLPPQTGEQLAESVVTENILPVRNTIRFPLIDTRKRPSSSSSYVRFPEHPPAAAYWWPHSWDRSQLDWVPPGYHSRPSYRRNQPSTHWAVTTF